MCKQTQPAGSASGAAMQPSDAGFNVVANIKCLYLLDSLLPVDRQVSSSRIRVGDLLLIEKDQRVPADMVLLRTTERSGACFIR